MSSPAVSGTSAAVQAQNKPSLTLKIQNTSFCLEQRDFYGNVLKAMEYLQAFCNKNIVTANSTESVGWGYDALYVNGKKHDIPSNGISLKMMLECCGEKTPKASIFALGIEILGFFTIAPHCNASKDLLAIDFFPLQDD
jgi:hypothetical protein